MTKFFKKLPQHKAKRDSKTQNWRVLLYVLRISEFQSFFNHLKYNDSVIIACSGFNKFYKSDVEYREGAKK
jgi:hypothetical protein